MVIYSKLLRPGYFGLIVIGVCSCLMYKPLYIVISLMYLLRTRFRFVRDFIIAYNRLISLSAVLPSVGSCWNFVMVLELFWLRFIILL